MLTIQTLIDYIIRSYTKQRLWMLFGGMILFIFLFGITGVFMGVGQPIGDSSTTITILDVLINYTEAEAYQQLEAYGETGRQVCLFSTLVLDSLFPLTFGSFFALLLAFLFKNTAYRIVILLPLVAVICDYIENTHIALLLIKYPEHLPTLVASANVFTLTKWITLGLVMMWISIGFFIKNRRYLEKHGSNF